MHFRFSSLGLRVFLPLLLFSIGCTQTTAVKPRVSYEPQTIIASFYGDQHAGLKTANGEIFDPEALTCAHRSYPFGTVIKATNPKNGKSVHVRVNDRGPYVRDRSLDLSKRAAREIGIDQEGVATVRIEVIKIGQARHSP